MIINFYYDDAQFNDQQVGIIDTRLLIKKADEWQDLPYIWNSEQTEPVLEITGGSHVVSILSKQSIDCQISNMGQCKGYHQKNGLLQSNGLTARQLNRDYLDTD